MPNLDGLMEFLNLGAAGLMSLGFLLLLYMMWRRGEKDGKAIDALTDREEESESLLGVVRCNTAAMTSICLAVSDNSKVIERLNQDVSGKLDDLGRDIRELREKI